MEMINVVAGYAVLVGFPILVLLLTRNYSKKGEGGTSTIVGFLGMLIYLPVIMLSLGLINS